MVVLAVRCFQAILLTHKKVKLIFFIMDLLNLKLPYIGEIIKFGTYHDFNYNGWVCTLTTFRDKDIPFPLEKIIGIQWFHPKLHIYRTHEQMLQMILNL